MNKQLIRQSKFLSLVLRHDPGRIGLVLDEAGWADVDDLLGKVNAVGVPMTRAELDTVVAQNNKQRFRLNRDGSRICANQGHSIEVKLDLQPQTPPAQLYHGTATRFLDNIRGEGLTRQRRHHVHLSSDKQTARSVGQRHGKPLILIVDAAAMSSAGYLFYLSENGVWLTDHVPVAYLTFPV